MKKTVLTKVNVQRPLRGDSGFTLVEMLVATGLVVLIMSLFAQIYGTAISTMRSQKGIGNNDQKARILNTVLRNDLKSLSYRQTSPAYGNAMGIVPMSNGDQAIIDSTQQQGYFYLSENDPFNPADDVLQFTIAIDARDFEDFRVGKAARLGNAVNQPIYDGGPSTAPGQSRYAEVSYFLRKGTLYRRVLLLRDVEGISEQPEVTIGNRFFGPHQMNYTGNFWKDFDYSATRKFFDPPMTGDPLLSYLWFHGQSSLLNLPGDNDVESLGLPWNRFGHFNDQRYPNVVGHGSPREYTKADGSGEFIGRFTQYETSTYHDATNSTLMSYPGHDADGSGNADPNFYRLMNRNVDYHYENDLIVSVDANDDENILSSGWRVGEDVLLTNVESFDVEVWEPDAQLFMQLGHPTVDEVDSMSGEVILSYFFSAYKRLNQGYGPVTNGNNNIFDTWHPQAMICTDSGGPVYDARPPYRPVRNTSNLSGVEWLPDTSYIVNASLPLSVLSQVDITDSSSVVQGNSWYYKVIRAGTSGSGPNPPEFPAVLGNIVQDGDVIWQCVDNRVGLSAIRITIRYLDSQTHTPRQISVVHSFAK